MKQEKDLSKSEGCLLNIFLSSIKDDTQVFIDVKRLISIGKEIHESLQPKPWNPSAICNGYYFDEVNVHFVHDKPDEELSLERQAQSKPQAERRLKNEQINNNINAWILENRDESKDCCYQIGFHENNYWSYSCHGVKPINSEMCDLRSVGKLCELLNAGLIHGVPKKMEV